MDSYDEVHDVKNGREVSTPELDVSSAIKFVNNDEDDDDKREEFVAKSHNVSEEVKWKVIRSKILVKITFSLRLL